MSDFSSIIFSPNFPLLPASARHTSYFQCRDLPKAPGCGACIDGEVEADGKFVRTVSGLRQINVNLNGWIGLRGAHTRVELIARLEAGKVVELRESKGEEIDDYSPLRGAYWSPNTWKPII